MQHFLTNILAVPIAQAQSSLTAGAVAEGTEGEIAKLVSFVISQIPLWITAVIVLILTFGIARMVKGSVENRLAKEGFEEENKEVSILASRTANVLVLVVGITVALKIAGIDLTSIIAAGAFGIGFALKDIIMNFIAGVMLLSARHYTIGDIIKVNGVMGTIVEIQTRATIVKAFDGTMIVLPNATLFKNKVISYTSNPFRKIQLEVGVNYSEDLKKTLKVIKKAVKNTRGVLVEPKPSLWFYKWADYSINLKVNAWCESRGGWIGVRNRLIINITKALDEAGIGIPYPIQTIEVSDQEKRLEYLVKQRAEAKEKQKVAKEKMEKQELKELKPAPATVNPNVNVDTEGVDAADWLKKAASSQPKPEAGEKTIPGIKPQQPPEQQPAAESESAPAEPIQSQPQNEQQPQPVQTQAQPAQQPAPQPNTTPGQQPPSPQQDQN